MPALVAGIHVLLTTAQAKRWMAGTRPGHDGAGPGSARRAEATRNPQLCAALQIVWHL